MPHTPHHLYSGCSVYLYDFLTCLCPASFSSYLWSHFLTILSLKKPLLAVPISSNTELSGSCPQRKCLGERPVPGTHQSIAGNVMRWREHSGSVPWVAGRHVLINPPDMSWHSEAGAQSALKRGKVAGLLFHLGSEPCCVWGEGGLAWLGPCPSGTHPLQPPPEGGLSHC